PLQRGSAAFAPPHAAPRAYSCGDGAGVLLLGGGDIRRRGGTRILRMARSALAGCGGHRGGAAADGLAAAAAFPASADDGEGEFMRLPGAAPDRARSSQARDGVSAAPDLPLAEVASAERRSAAG